MKTIFHITVIIILSLFSFQNLFAQEEVIALSEPVVATDTYEMYGSEMDETYTLSDLSGSQNPEAFDGSTAFFGGTMTRVCQHRGCNFFLDDGEQQVRVRFKDYEFFIPTNTDGKKAVVRGHFVEKEEEDETVIEILSDSIKIYR